LQRSAALQPQPKGEKIMNVMTASESAQPVSSGFRVDVSRRQRIVRVSSEWFSRPDDERYLNLPDLYEAVRGRAERAQARTVESNAIKVEANRDIPERLALTVPGRGEPVAPTGVLASCARLLAHRHRICGNARQRCARDQPATWLAVASG
jgi:hypothetical protein